MVGARPQFIKAGVVSRALMDFDNINEKIVHTGQHYDKNMSDVFFVELNIPKPSYELNVQGKTHGEMTGQQLQAVEAVLLKEKPDLVIVYGDTNSTLAGALAAAKLGVKIAHVEAGLRSYDRRMPEEINRVLTDHVSDILFTTSAVATNNLTKEGLDPKSFHQVGDVMYDCAIEFSGSAKKPTFWPKTFSTAKPFILATIHRQEKTDSFINLNEIFRGLSECNFQVLMPLHPRSREALKTYGIKPAENIFLINPVSYFEMLWLLQHCDSVVTDSGGLQKEAFFHNKSCVVVRENTE